MVQQYFLESYRRQAEMVNCIAQLVTETNRKTKTDPEGWSLDFHLAHIHEVRYWWTKSIRPEAVEVFGDVFVGDWPDMSPIDDLAEIRNQLSISGDVVLSLTKDLLDAGVEKIGGYDHPVLYLQHMLWHEGYHFGLINLGLRLAGEEPSDEWSEKHVWEKWRGPEE